MFAFHYSYFLIARDICYSVGPKRIIALSSIICIADAEDHKTVLICDQPTEVDEEVVERVGVCSLEPDNKDIFCNPEVRIRRKVNLDKAAIWSIAGIN